MPVKKLKLYLLIGLLIINPSTVFAQACETTIDGNCRLDVDIVDYEGVPAPSVSPLGKGRRYFDATSNTFKCSENGAAFVDCDGDTTGGNPGGADTQVQFNDAGSFGGDPGFTFNKTTNDIVVTGIGTFSGAGDSRFGTGGTKSDGYTISNSAEVQTTDATQTILDTIPLLDENAYVIMTFVSAVRSDGLARNGRIITGVFFRTGAGSATQAGTTIDLIDQPPASGIAVTYTVGGNNVRVSVTGIAAQTWNFGTTSVYINMSN